MQKPRLHVLAEFYQNSFIFRKFWSKYRTLGFRWFRLTTRIWTQNVIGTNPVPSPVLHLHRTSLFTLCITQSAQITACKICMYGPARPRHPEEQSLTTTTTTIIMASTLVLLQAIVIALLTALQKISKVRLLCVSTHFYWGPQRQ